MELTPLKSVRKHCLWCCKDDFREVKLCPAEGCPIHVFRMGRGSRGKGKSVVKTIRKKCLDCSGFFEPNVKNCKFNGKQDTFCYLYPYRMGKAPNRKRKKVGCSNSIESIPALESAHSEAFELGK